MSKQAARPVTAATADGYLCPGREGRDAFLLKHAARALRAWVKADLAENEAVKDQLLKEARLLTGRAVGKGVFRKAKV